MIAHHRGVRFFVHKGERVSFEKLYLEHWKMLCSVANKLTNNQEATKDIVQEVFLSFLQRYQEKDIENVSAYLLQALRYKCFQWLRNDKIADRHLARMNTLLSENVTENDVGVRLLYDEIDKVVSEMPARPREIFKLSRYENLPNDEIAVKLNISHRTVENHLTKALQMLRMSLKTVVLVVLCVKTFALFE